MLWLIDHFKALPVDRMDRESLFSTPDIGAKWYNQDQPCTYLDLSTLNGLDIAEYPDSGKINILPDQDIYHLVEKSDYYDGEERVREIWRTLGYPASID